MELLKPDYYDEFTCIADKCTISCCREWKINIDDETYRNWKTIQPPSEVPGHRSDRVIISMGSICDVAEEVIDYLNAKSTTVLSWQRTDCAIW